ncbi:MAG: hypothetical protein OEV85_09050 [Candidatus Thorarchaeota archaeon]|nr:hypothetical protein [Candidatus Thorarchaeota archaeon]
MPDRAIRKLINNERKFLWSPGANVSVVARIEGNVPIDSLRSAIKEISQKHPLVSSKVGMEKNRVLYFIHDPEIEIPLVVIKRESETQWIDVIRSEFTVAFKQFEGPLIRFVLIHSESVSDLVVIAQHAICDGTALAFLIRDILLLTVTPQSPLTTIEPNILLPELLSKGQDAIRLGQRAKSFFIRRIDDKWKRNPFYFDDKDFLAIHDAFNQEYQYDAVLLELDKEKTSILTETCRSNGVTVNSALTTAFNAAFNDIIEKGVNKPRRVVLPYDLRNRINPPLGDVFCLLVGSIDFSFKYNKSKSFWENVGNLHKSIQSRIEKGDMFASAMDLESLDPTLVDVLVSFALLAKNVPKESIRYKKLNSFANDKNNVAIDLGTKFLDQLPKVINTNLGRLEFPKNYGQLTLKTMYFAPSGGTKVPVIMGAVGVSDVLTITLSYYHVKDGSPTITCSQLEQIRDKALSYLDLIGPQ